MLLIMPTGHISAVVYVNCQVLLCLRLMSGVMVRAAVTEGDAARGSVQSGRGAPCVPRNSVCSVNISEALRRLDAFAPPNARQEPSDLSSH